MKLSEITKRNIAAKLEKLNHVPAQKAHTLVVIKMFFRWALHEGYIELDPAASFKRQKRHAMPKAATFRVIFAPL